MDRISVKGMSFYGHHGVDRREQETGQPFEVDLELRLDLSRAGSTDHLEDSVDYVEAYRYVRTVVEGSPRRLLEAVATEIAEGILDRFPVQAVAVTIKKPHAPLGGLFGSVEVSLERCR